MDPKQIQTDQVVQSSTSQDVVAQPSQGAGLSTIGQQVVAQTVETQAVPPVKADEQSGKQIFSRDFVQKTETPQWLTESDKAAKGKIADVGGASAGSFVIPNIHEEKPTSTELGINPASRVEVKPSLEVISKVDIEAAAKMAKAGYDPKTGHRLVELQELQSTEIDKAKFQETAKQKKSVLDKLKSLFSFHTDQHKEVVEKVDKGVAVKISSQEKQKYIEAEKIYQEGLASIKDLIAPASMEILYDKIHMDGFYAQSFYVFSYPRYLDVNWLAPVINFDVTMDISQFIYPIGSADIMKILRKKVAQMQSGIRINSERGMVRDPALETALEDAEQLRTEIQRGQEKFFQFALYFTIYSDSEKKLEKVSKQLESLLGGKLVMVKRASIQAEHGFNSCLPLCLDEIYTIRNMNTSPLSTTFPFTSSDLTSDKGILYGLNRHNDSLIIFDRFALENANSVVFAKSGAGKSYSVKLEILRMMMMGTDVIVIDPENEYEALANTVGGTYLRLSLNSDRRINPFDLPKPIEGDEVQAGDLLRSNIITLHGLLKLMLEEITPGE